MLKRSKKYRARGNEIRFQILKITTAVLYLLLHHLYTSKYKVYCTLYTILLCVLYL